MIVSCATAAGPLAIISWHDNFLRPRGGLNRPGAVGLSLPVYVTAAPGDDTRLFILRQHTGNIRIFDRSTNTLLATPFLHILGVTQGGEQGLSAWPSIPTTPPTAGSSSTTPMPAERWRGA